LNSDYGVQHILINDQFIEFGRVFFLFLFKSDGYRIPYHIEGWTQQDELNIPVYTDILKAARTHSRWQITSNTTQRTLPN
jgi:hypothetical protein